MHKPKNISITIVGSGLAGCFLAVLLAERGYKVVIYERLSKKEICSVASRRSYNIILFGYAIDLLKKAGIWETIHPYLYALKGSLTHVPHETHPIVRIMDYNKMPYLAISRAKLVEILLHEATKHPLVAAHFNTSLFSIDRHKKTITVQNNVTKKIETHHTDIVFGADGANSSVRIFLQQGQSTQHTQEYAIWRYRQFRLSPKTVEKLGLEKGFEHTWTQKNAFIISHADKTHALSALLVTPKDVEKNPFSSATTIKKFFAENFPDLLPAIKEITEALLINPDGNFATIHTDPWYYKDFIALLGDAAHGFYPFFGQGTSAAFGDGMLLAKLIDQYGSDWNKVFSAYQQTRKQHMDVLGDLSKEVMLKYFRYRKADFTAIYDALENGLYKLFPKMLYPPLSFSLLTDPEHSYTHWKNHRKQRKIARWLGISLFVILVTSAVSYYEKIGNRQRMSK